MSQSRKSSVGLWTIFFFAAAILCSSMTAATPASASEMPDCSKQSAAAESAEADGSSVCAFGLAHTVLPKQIDIQRDFLTWNTLPKVDFSRLFLGVIAQWKNTSRLKPKEKIHLLNSVLSI